MRTLWTYIGLLGLGTVLCLPVVPGYPDPNEFRLVSSLAYHSILSTRIYPTAAAVPGGCVPSGSVGLHAHHVGTFTELRAKHTAVHPLSMLLFAT